MTPKKIFSGVALTAFLYFTAARAQEKLGKVSFPTSCDPKVQNTL